jgi:hypothetical protein
MAEHSVLLEAKGSYFLETPEQRTRLRKIIAALKAEKIHLIVILDSEIQEPGFQEDLEDIRRVRPLVGHFRPNLNKDLFDPLGNAPREPELVRRWTAAQAECDAFLTRIMRRDPDDLVPAEQN